MKSARIDYDRLIQAYWQNLSTMLRGFDSSAGLEFLQAWVPEEDIAKNIVGISEAARQAGIGELTIEFKPETIGTTDLSAILGDRAEVHADKSSGGISMIVRFREDRAERSSTPTAQTSAPKTRKSETRSRHRRMSLSNRQTGRLVDQMHAVYRQALKEVLKDIRSEGEVSQLSGMVVVNAEEDSIRLASAVNPKDHQIRMARHQGAKNEVQRALLERLCRIMEGRPILECSDHATIYLEESLRDRSRPPPVAGVVTPESADPAFRLPSNLVRMLFADYQRQTGFAEQENRFVVPSAPGWSKLSSEERFKAVQAALQRFSGGGEFELVRLEGPSRVVLERSKDLDFRVAAARLMELEIYLRTDVDPGLQMHLQARMDMNKLRQGPRPDP